MTNVYVMTPDDVWYFQTAKEAKAWINSPKTLNMLYNAYKDKMDYIYNSGYSIKDPLVDIIIEIIPYNEYRKA